MPVGEGYGQVLVLIEKKGAEYICEEVGECIFVPLIRKNDWGE